jgi:hypothetical protein
MTFLQKATPSSGFKEPDEGSKAAGPRFLQKGHFSLAIALPPYLRYTMS